jgi:hypothetical protein
VDRRAAHTRLSPDPGKLDMNASPGQRSSRIEGCDLLVCSTDKFRAEAEITIGQLKRLGFASMFDCYLLLGDLNPEIEGFRILNRRAPGTWSSELRDGLLQLQKPYVLLWLDDFTPLDTAPLDSIQQMISRFIDLDGNYLRLNPTPSGHGAEVFPGVREVLPGEMYRTATVYSVWRRDVLLSVLDDAETAWQFELVGSARSDSHPGFYASTRELIGFVNLVIKGLVDPRAERLLEARGVHVDSVKRPRMNTSQLARQRFRDERARIFRLLPWRVRRALRNWFSTNPHPNA